MLPNNPSHRSKSSAISFGTAERDRAFSITDQDATMHNDDDILAVKRTAVVHRDPGDDDETFVMQRVLAGRGWQPGDRLELVAENNRLTEARITSSHGYRVDGDLAVDATLIEDVQRLLKLGFGSAAFVVDFRRQLMHTELNLTLAPAHRVLPTDDLIEVLNSTYLARVKQAYGAWWTPGTKTLDLSYGKNGRVIAGRLVMRLA